MTTLRTFQTEIDEIHSREVVKQRAKASAALAEKEKEAKDQKLAGISQIKGKGKDDASNANPTAAVIRASLLEFEDRILKHVLSRNPTEHTAARDMIAELLTQHHGEYVFRIGAQPPHAELFSGELTDETPGWTGTGRTMEQMDEARETFRRLVDEVGGKVSLLFESRNSTHPRITLLLRLPPPNVSLTPEVRCAVVGNVDSGKSTTLGVLTRGSLDDGRGKARVALFRHKHEIETGRTSSVGMEILGFGPSGAPILPQTIGTDENTTRHEKLSWEEISLQAAKIVSFIDLAGHERYLKTTLYGLTSGAPSCVILIVGANAGLIGMSKEHLAIALALGVPVVVCVTKIDMTPAPKLAESVKQVTKILQSPGCRKTPVFVKDTETSIELATSFGSERICPIFQISNVTGEGLNHVGYFRRTTKSLILNVSTVQLRTFLNLLPSSEHDVTKFAVDQPLEISIIETWSVPYVGTVVNGIINSGVIKAGETVLLGPDANGNYRVTAVKSIHRKRAIVTTAEAGQCVSLALKRVKRTEVRKGMVLVPKTDTPPRAVSRFEGQVLILYHNTTLQRNYQPHRQAVRQTVRIVGMDHPQGILRTGDRAKVQFEFISHPEFVKEGMKLLFREGKTKVCRLD
ncbi:GTP-binding protein 1 [Leucoagaricus sp. SymC.cos]|nr:GTP-binding protein 1 [Leucoagaricus sp. SymC.cos]